jgi:glutamine amidotransferase
MTDIAVIDYGMGNLRSVAKAIEHVAPGQTVSVTSDPRMVAAASRVVFPGKARCRIACRKWTHEICVTRC